MKIILYTKENENSERLIKALNTIVAKEKLEVIKSISSFTKRVNEFITETVIFILMPSTKEELHIMNSIYELLYNINPKILILPDRDKETVCMGFRLYPRFVEYADSNFMSLSAVLNKMVKNIG